MSSVLTLDTFLTRFNLLCPICDTVTQHGRQAAVLVPIIRRPQPGLLLTQRSSELRLHAGQVAFPGGAWDETDESLVATALREAQEEIAMPPEAVDIIGVLPPRNSVTGFQVTPVVGLVPPDLPYRVCEDEVACLFEMPLTQALALERYHPLDIQRCGNTRRIWISWYQHYTIWGMTAGIIHELAHHVSLK